MFSETQVLRRHRKHRKRIRTLTFSSFAKPLLAHEEFRQCGTRRPPSSFYIIWAWTGGLMEPIWRLLVLLDRLSQHFGERSDDPDRWVSAEDVVVWCVCHGRYISRAA